MARAVTSNERAVVWQEFKRVREWNLSNHRGDFASGRSVYASLVDDEADIDLHDVAVIAEWLEFSAHNRIEASVIAYFGSLLDDGGPQDTRRLGLATVARAGHVESLRFEKRLTEEVLPYLDGEQASGVKAILAWLAFLHGNPALFTEVNV